jgi:hypothetical protein
LKEIINNIRTAKKTYKPTAFIRVANSMNYFLVTIHDFYIHDREIYLTLENNFYNQQREIIIPDASNISVHLNCNPLHLMNSNYILDSMLPFKMEEGGMESVDPKISSVIKGEGSLTLNEGGLTLVIPDVCSMLRFAQSDEMGAKESTCVKVNNYIAALNSFNKGLLEEQKFKPSCVLYVGNTNTLFNGVITHFSSVGATQSKSIKLEDSFDKFITSTSMGSSTTPSKGTMLTVGIDTTMIKFSQDNFEVSGSGQTIESIPFCLKMEAL